MDKAFVAIADPTRRALLDQLSGGPRPAGALVPPVPMSQPAVSRHLRILREAGLVSATKQGRTRVYALCPGALRPVADWLVHYEQFWSDRLDRLGETLHRLASEER